MNNTGTATWMNGRGLNLPGGSSSNLSAFPAVRLPDSLLAGLDDVTIAYDVRATGTAAGRAGLHLRPELGERRVPRRHARQQQLDDGPPPGLGRWPRDRGSGVAAPASLARNVWKHVAVTLRGGDATTPGEMLLYEDGVLVGTNAAVTLKPSDITSPTASSAARTSRGHRASVRGSDQGLQGLLLGPHGVQIAALSAALAPGNLQELMDGVTLGNTSALTGNLTLPSVPGMTWSTSDPSVITATGVITPATGQRDRRDSDADRELHLPGPHQLQGLRDHGPEAGPFTVEQLNQGLVHYFKLDETSGTTLVNSGSAGTAGNATLMNPDKAALTGNGVRFNPDTYENALNGGYVEAAERPHRGHDEPDGRLRRLDRPGQRR